MSTMRKYLRVLTAAVEGLSDRIAHPIPIKQNGSASETANLGDVLTVRMRTFNFEVFLWDRRTLALFRLLERRGNKHRLRFGRGSNIFAWGR
jgi:hypothetical protein